MFITYKSTEYNIINLIIELSWKSAETIFLCDQHEKQVTMRYIREQSDNFDMKIREEKIVDEGKRG